MSAIVIDGLRKSYDGFELAIDHLELPDGCIMGLVGENGAGKSTTLRLILNSARRDAGRIEVLGQDNESPDFGKLKSELGVVFDEAYFPEVLTARQVNKVMKHTYANWREQEYFDLLRRFDLPGNKPFKEYSRGMRMKQAIAVALAHEPRLLLLDEATGGLDPMVRDEILDIFRDFTRNGDNSVLISSHIVSDLEKICDYIAFLHKGKLRFCLSMDELNERYAILRCTRAEFGQVPPDAVVGKRDNGYGVEALLLRDRAQGISPLERAGIEDIMVYMAKGE